MISNFVFAPTSGVEKSCVVPNIWTEPIRESAFFPTVSEGELHSLHLSLKPHEAAGFDGTRREDLCRNFEKI